MTDEIQIPKTRFIATNDVEKLTPRRPYVAERFYLQMKNGPDLVLVRDVDYEATEKERDHWKARAERAEAEAAELRAELARIRAAGKYYGCPKCGAKLALNDPARPLPASPDDGGEEE